MPKHQETNSETHRHCPAAMDSELAMAINIHRLLGPPPLSTGMRHVMVIVDRFSTAVRLIPMQDKYSARHTCHALITEIYARLGNPIEIITDRGPRPVSNYFTELQEAFGVHLLPSTAFHQNTNGSAEHTIKSVAQNLRAYNKRQNDWAIHLWRAEYASTMRRPSGLISHQMRSA